MLRKLPYGANYIGLTQTPELASALEDGILFRYGAPDPSVSDRFDSAAKWHSVTTFEMTL